MDLYDDEILGFWKKLHDKGVIYILVGGFATNLHGFSRTTGDLDLWIKDTKENRDLFRKSLEEIGCGEFTIPQTGELIPGWSVLKLPSGFELDVMTSLKGFPQERFNECLALAPTALIRNIPIRFLHLNQLIEAKEASARPKDQIDLIELKKMKGEK